MHRVLASHTEWALSACMIPAPVQHGIDAAVLYGRSFTLLTTQTETANPAAEQATLCLRGALARRESFLGGAARV